MALFLTELTMSADDILLDAEERMEKALEVSQE